MKRLWSTAAVWHAVRSVAIGFGILAALAVATTGALWGIFTWSASTAVRVEHGALDPYAESLASAHPEYLEVIVYAENVSWGLDDDFINVRIWMESPDSFPDDGTREIAGLIGSAFPELRVNLDVRSSTCLEPDADWSVCEKRVFHDIQER